MESLTALFSKPDPQAQMRKCNALLRSNARQLDRELARVKQQEAKAKNLILQADKRAARDPARQAQARREIRDFAGEIVRNRREQGRLVTAKAQLSSVQMQVNEAFAMRKIEGSIRSSVVIMRDLNSLIRLPELVGSMRELSAELVKADILEEMVSDSLPEDVADPLDESELEVDEVLRELLKDRAATTPKLPTAPESQSVDPVQLGPQGEAQEGAEEEDTQEMMHEMRSRLEALRS